ncbi:MAG TPA: helix-turn-helix domain-containing protein [Ktedonobacterales bacterium]|nr:helix-turn-helix domain-containing protein [Ktedonobacterales bacterium]
MGARATASAQTGQRILQAAKELYMERWLEDLTLDEVAARAGVTVQTVLRRFGSKNGLIEATGANLSEQIMRQRNQAPAGDVAGAVANLMEHYEATGDLTIRTLAQEERHEILRVFAQQGRVIHRAWAETAFAPYLSACPVERRDALLAKLIVATDLYVWKLFRRNMGLGREQTERAITEMVSAIIDSDK